LVRYRLVTGTEVVFFGKTYIFVRMTDGELAKVIGDNIRAARAEAGLTQAALSVKAGILVPHISRMESGAHLPSVASLKRVADALELPICALLDPPPSRATGKRKRK
jgi:ribosome-binding protein aMBF1 (putative translation factor)